jgi:hypothetical protein
MYAIGHKSGINIHPSTPERIIDTTSDSGPRGYPGGYFGIFRAFATPFGYIIIDSGIGYFAILLQTSGFAQILLLGYSHFAANEWIRRPDIRIFRDFATGAGT